MAGKVASEVAWIEILAKEPRSSKPLGLFFFLPPMSQWWVQQRKSGLSCRYLGTLGTKEDEGTLSEPLGSLIFLQAGGRSQ